MTDPVSGWWFFVSIIVGCALIMGMEWLEKLLFDGILRPKGNPYG